MSLLCIIRFAELYLEGILMEENSGQIAKKKRGRPKGSKNKPKPPKAQPYAKQNMKQLKQVLAKTKSGSLYEQLQNLAIIDKGGRMMPLVPNWAQRELIGALSEQAKRNLPMRAIILKARQMGMSTVTQALMFLNCNGLPNYSALVAAHNDDSSTNVFDKARIMQEMLPDGMKRPMAQSNRKELIWAAPHRSRLIVQTAGRKSLGRSYTLQSLHASELAFWPNPTESMNAVSQSFPNTPGTLMVIESTANGMAGEFYTRWVNAVKQQSEDPFTGFVPIFLPWTVFADYRMPVKDHRDGLDQLDEEEARLRADGVDDEQLEWRRMMIRDYCSGDVMTFKQEYPKSWQEAFQVSGRIVFDEEAMMRHAGMIRDGKKVRLARDSSQRIMQISADEMIHDHWEIWHEPTEYGKYTIGVDVAEGNLVDPLDVRSKTDYSAIVVYSRKHNRVEAVYRSRVPPDRLAEQVILGGRYYNTALVAPEINGPGFAVIEHLRANSYRKLYVRESAEDKIRESSGSMYGWKTNATTRDKMIDDWDMAIRSDANGSYEDSLDLYSDILVDEEQSFVAKQRGPTSRQTRRESLSGKHDDVLFAAMIALQAHLRQPAERPMIVIDW